MIEQHLLALVLSISNKQSVYESQVTVRDHIHLRDVGHDQDQIEHILDQKSWKTPHSGRQCLS
jgi:hypothetical protein